MILCVCFFVIIGGAYSHLLGHADGDGYAVTCLDFSSLSSSNMFLSGHASPNASRFDLSSSHLPSAGSGLVPDGMLNVWHMLNSSKPEYRLQCQSMITSAVFHPTSNHMILGSTVGGQIVAWDLRSKKNTPQFRSRSGHYAPVFSMQFLGSTGAAAAARRLNFVTVSNVGQVCLWKDDFLVSPQVYSAKKMYSWFCYLVFVLFCFCWHFCISMIIQISMCLFQTCEPLRRWASLMCTVT